MTPTRTEYAIKSDRVSRIVPPLPDGRTRQTALSLDETAELVADYDRFKLLMHSNRHVVDEAYSSLLVKCPDLNLEDVCLLDRIQKHLAVPAAAVAHLRREGLIEGRMPHGCSSR